MTKRKSLSTKIENLLYDHPLLKGTVHHGIGAIVVIFSAFLFAFGFKAFIAPGNLEQMADGHRLISGGVSGIAQTIILLIDLVGNKAVSGNHLYDLTYSILYFGLNIPIFILAWKGIGKRFAILTAINVGMASVFNYILGYADEAFLFKIAEFCNQNGGLITRALFAGVCTGVSSAIAYKANASAGGIDVIAYYISLKKSTLVGRYSVYINIITVTTYTLLAITEAGWGTVEGAHAFTASLFSVVYMIMTMLVIDVINLRNKKMKLEVVSSNPDLGKIIMANLPHGATLIKGEGAFTGAEKFIFNVIVSRYEVKHAVKVVQNADPKAFVIVTELHQVYGNFFLPPIK